VTLFSSSLLQADIAMADFEDNEDPLKDPKPLRIIEDEEDESGGGIDYRRMFKGYLSPSLSSTLYLPSIRKDMKKFQSIPKRGEKDFEPDGTNKQKNLLQEGREAMYAALSFKAGLYRPHSLSLQSLTIVHRTIFLRPLTIACWNIFL
jgi:hypothetical protein